MTSAQDYRKLATQLRVHARHSDNPRLRTEWEHLAKCYVRLADQADQNSRLDASYEPPMGRSFGGGSGEPC